MERREEPEGRPGGPGRDKGAPGSAWRPQASKQQKEAKES